MADTKLRDYTTIGGIKDMILNDIAPNYFPDMSEVSTLNTGLFGMISDISSTGLFDNMQVASRYITEIIPGQSRLPEFIYAQANNYGISDLFAKCSRCNAMIMIKESDIIRQENYNSTYGRYSYTIKEDIVVYIDNIPFSIPYDIQINSKKINGTYNHVCRYKNSIISGNTVDQFTNSIIGDPDPPYVKCIKTHIVDQTDVYLGLSVTLYQYTKVVKTENLVTNSVLNIPMISIDYNDKLCNIEVYYKAPSDTNYSYLPHVLETTPATTTPFIYYKLVDDDSYRLSFANDDRYFVPKYNSELKIVTYQTLGKEGSFGIYDGDDIYVETPDPLVNLFCVMTTESIGGDDPLTLEELRRMTWERQLTIHSYTTDNDLNKYFTLTYLNYGTKSLFIKIRDDFVTRVYACYTRLQDENNIYPTNTLRASIGITYWGEDKINDSVDSRSIRAGTVFKYKQLGINEDGTPIYDLLRCEINDDPIDPTDKDTILYTNPFLISISTKPYSVGYYLNSVDKIVQLEYRDLDKNDTAPFQFIANNVRFFRDAVNETTESNYTISMNIIPTDITINTSNIVNTDGVTAAAESEDILLMDTSSEDVTELNWDKVKLFLVVNTEDSLYYLPMEKSTNVDNPYRSFSVSIQTDDYLKDSKIRLLGLNTLDDDGVVIESSCMVEMNNPNLTFALFYDTPSSIEHDFVNSIPETNCLTLCNKYASSSEDLYLCQPMSMFDSSVKIYQYSDEWIETVNNNEVIHSTRDCFELTNVPLFSNTFLKDRASLSDVLNRITDYYAFIKDMALDITANFSISLRFFNTFGYSNLFSISDGMGNSKILSRTNCDISISIKFFDNVEYTTSLNSIKVTIKNYIESITDSNNTGINKLSISMLINKLYTDYPNDIDYIIFNNINGMDSSYQYITTNYDLSAAENNMMIPEYITLALEDIHIKPLNKSV